jgi:hypothetical protein
MPNDPIALGQAISKNTAVALSKSKLSDKDRIAVLEQQVAHMSKIIQGLKNKDKHAANAYEGPQDNLNKDGLPIGLICFGVSSKLPFPSFLEVEEDGYIVGTTLYDSLSAAAEAVSGVRRSGWTFWKLNNGTTLKEAFKDR